MALVSTTTASSSPYFASRLPPLRRARRWGSDGDPDDVPVDGLFEKARHFGLAELESLGDLGLLESALVVEASNPGDQSDLVVWCHGRHHGRRAASASTGPCPWARASRPLSRSSAVSRGSTSASGGGPKRTTRDHARGRHRPTRSYRTTKLHCLDQMVRANGDVAVPSDGRNVRTMTGSPWVSVARRSTNCPINHSPAPCFIVAIGDPRRSPPCSRGRCLDNAWQHIA